MLAKVPLSYIPIDSTAVKRVLDSYEGRSHETIISDFEKELSSFTKAKCVVALNSGTAAIHLALRAVGVGSNDEVLVSTFTYVATVNPILYLKANPIFIDVEKQSWNMDPELLEVAIKSRLSIGAKPKAILVVHTYGMPAMMDEIMKISLRYEIPVVEDAAEALGSRIGGKYVGTFGKIGILSFNNNKILTTYGGGAILTDDADLAQKIAFWAGQSRESRVYYEHKELGYNYRMGPMNAAVGLSKISNLETEISQRRRCFDEYQQLFSKRGFQFQVEGPDFFSNRWLTVASLTSALQRDSISKRLDSQGIETRFAWNPMHKQPLFRDYDYFTENEVSEMLFSKSICLPFFVKQKESIAGEIADIIGYN